MIGAFVIEYTCMYIQCTCIHSCIITTSLPAVDGLECSDLMVKACSDSDKLERQHNSITDNK